MKKERGGETETGRLGDTVMMNVLKLALTVVMYFSPFFVFTGILVA